MGKRKRGVKKTDRLGELPDSLIFDIFRFLPITYVVRTTILSKRWKNLWTTVPWLDFNDSKIENTDKLRNLIGGAISSWRGIKIKRFNVKFDYEHDKSLDSDIDSWVRFAMDRKVEDLIIDMPCSNSFYTELHSVPQCLYSCSSLKVLRLRSFDLQIHGSNVQWDQMTSLDFGTSLSENAMNQILLGSPQLESLCLSLVDFKANMSIRSSSLKSLYIENVSYDFISRDTELRICTPNLKTLEFGAVPFRKCLLMNVSSLTKAFLMVDVPRAYGRNLFPRTDFVVEALSQILPAIKHVSGVTLTNCCIEALGDVKEKHMLSPFPNADFLELRVCSEEYEQIVGVLEMFPNLRNLVLETTYRSLPQHDAGCFKFDKNIGSSFLWQLRRVDVTWNMGDESIFPLIQILLKYASKLEKMVIRKIQIETRTSWKSLFMQLQKLLRMQRSSPTAELIFC